MDKLLLDTPVSQELMITFSDMSFQKELQQLSIRVNIPLL
jgi:hypothetical protein